MITLNGTEMAKALLEEISPEIETYKLTLAIILVGNDPSSLIYTSNKVKTAARLGIETKLFHFQDSISKEDLWLEIEKLNFSPEITGILIQLPLPGGRVAREFLDMVDPLKDVDGLHPLNMGMLYEGDENSALIPCTPQGCIHLIESSGIKLEGKKALVIGRSLIVGKPLSLMLSARGATVTLAHSKTLHLKEEAQNAEILVVAVGSPGLVEGDWVRKGAVVIDVGMTRLSSGAVTGDVNFEQAKENAFAITPVPRGVGPMTIAYLMKNIAKAASLQKNRGK